MMDLSEPKKAAIPELKLKLLDRNGSAARLMDNELLRVVR